MSPLALGLMMGAGSSSKAAERLGVSRVVAAGLVGLAVMLALTDPLGAADRHGHARASGSSASPWRWAGSWLPPPSAVVGAVPAAKSGIASATNTVARMVSGALGVAVIGSLVSSLYSNDVDGSLVGCPPRRRPAPRTRSARRASIAAQLPGDAGSSLLATAGDAFTQAMGVGLLVAAALAAAAAALVVLRFLPSREPAAHRQTASPSISNRRTEKEQSCHRNPRDGRSPARAILTALVLGSAYWATRPGSDTPAANGKAPAREYAPIERFVQDEMKVQRIPGLALGIVKDDRIVYVRGFGKADDSGRPVTPRTPFIIGSLSKSFTAMAIMQLVEAGKVELDAPVQRYLPWFRVADEDASRARSPSATS